MEIILLVVFQQLLTGHDGVVLGVAAAEGILQALLSLAGYAILELEVDEVCASHAPVACRGVLVFCLGCLGGFAEAGAANKDSLIG